MHESEELNHPLKKPNVYLRGLTKDVDSANI